MFKVLIAALVLTISFAAPPTLDDPAAELTRQRAEVQKAYDAINSVNPMAKGGQPNAAMNPLPVPTSSSPVLDERIQQAQKLLNNPIFKTYLNILSNPVISESMEKFFKHPERMKVIYGEIALFLLMFFYRAWRIAKAKHWFGRAWVNLYTFVGAWISAIIVVPAIFFGREYLDTLYFLSWFLTKP